ncbi:MAG: hypothetical protein AAGA83_10015 [Cyanobacteria bacterium P01_F01_bin.116]
MNSAKALWSPNNQGQDHATGQSSAEQQDRQDNTMALVYPDGRVTNVKVRQKKSFS